MKKTFGLLFVALLISSCILGQNSPVLDKTVYETGAIDNTGVRIPLYEIELEGINLPIFLQYDNTGIRVNSAPSSVGMNWNLSAGGIIEREVRGIPDEFKGPGRESEIHGVDTITGWFHDKRVIERHDGTYMNDNWSPGATTPNVVQGYALSIFNDNSPDIYNFYNSNGDYSIFTFKKHFDDIDSPISEFDLEAISLDENQRYQVIPNYNVLEDISCTDCEDFIIKSNEGITYSFRKGIEKESPYFDGSLQGGLPSEQYYFSLYDFNLKEIRSEITSETINLSYGVSTYLNEYSLYSQAGFLNPNTENSSGSSENILISNVHRREVSEISSTKERIVFNYTPATYSVVSSEDPNNTEYFQQNINLLESVYIFDHNQNFIGGYRFEYQQYQGPDGKPFLETIYKINPSNEAEIYREFEYYNPDYVAGSLNLAQDALGYSNGAWANSTHDINGERNFTVKRYRYSQDFAVEAADRGISEEYLKYGMLYSMSNRFGGKTVYDYQANQTNADILGGSGIIYFGGVLVKSVKVFDQNNALLTNKEYAYENGNGFGVYIDQENKPYLGHFVENDPSENQDSPTSGSSIFSNNNPLGNSGFLVVYGNIFDDNLFNTDLTIDPIVNNQTRGAFFEKVTETILSNANNSNTLGKTVRYYQPNYNLENRTSILTKVENFDNQNNILRSNEYIYQAFTQNQINVIELDSWSFNSNENCYANEDDPRIVEHPVIGTICLVGTSFSLEEDFIYDIDYSLQEEINRTYDLTDNSFTSNSIEYTYLNDVGSNLYLKEAIYKNNQSEIFQREKYLYLSEINNIPVIYNQLLEYSNPIIDITNWKTENNEEYLNNSQVYEYLPDGKLKNRYFLSVNNNGTKYTSNTYVLPSYDSNSEFSTIAEQQEKYIYNQDDKVESKIDYLTGIKESYQRSNDYLGNYINAILYENSSSESNTISHFKHISFESGNEVNTVSFNNAFSGDYVFSGTTISLGTFDQGTVISYWEYQGGNWNYKRSIHSGGNIVINKTPGAQYIDEIRVLPPNSQMRSFTFKPLIGAETIVDENSEATKQEYDSFNRLIRLRDQFGNIIEEYNYNSIGDNN
ncbi:hypothetical protein [uncultured Dokdonia sp.]|uniref:hypothetical protein n=1 Tax=uncultured Dokdonia sp. TaxID=575653 RepID=UPI00260AADFA|nr:hypothetical protein [uncultured Dokdonia sp.]